MGSFRNMDENTHNYHHPPFIQHWWQFFDCEKWTLLLHPLEGHGYWDGKQVFGLFLKILIITEPLLYSLELLSGKQTIVFLEAG